MGDLLRIFRPGSYLLFLDLGLIHAGVGIVVAIVIFTFMAASSLSYFYAYRTISVGKPLDRLHIAALKVLGTLLIVLGKGSILIFLEILLSPVLCLIDGDTYPGCKSTILGNWYAMLIGITISLALAVFVGAAATFSTRECFLKTNYLSSATSSCEVLDLSVKISSLVCAILVKVIYRPIAGGVNCTYYRF